MSFNTFAIVSLISYFGMGSSIGMSILFGFLGGTGMYASLHAFGTYKILKKNQLTSKDFRYIQQNLKEASLKVKRLNMVLFRVRSLQSAKYVSRLHRATTKIFQLVKKEPKRFYQGERFFFYHLDSVVEIAERYVFLQKHDKEDGTMREAEQAMDRLILLLEDDLRKMVAKDVEDLTIELEVTNKTYKRTEK